MIDWGNFTYAFVLVGTMAALSSVFFGDWKIVPITFAGIAAYTISDIVLGNPPVILVPALAGIGTILAIGLPLYLKPAKQKEK